MVTSPLHMGLQLIQAVHKTTFQRSLPRHEEINKSLFFYLRTELVFLPPKTSLHSHSSLKAPPGASVSPCVFVHVLLAEGSILEQSARPPQPTWHLKGLSESRAVMRKVVRPRFLWHGGATAQPHALPGEVSGGPTHTQPVTASSCMQPHLCVSCAVFTLPLPCRTALWGP